MAEHDVGEIRLVRKWFYHLMTAIFRPILVGYFRLSSENASVVPQKGPGILLINHVNFFDPLWVYVMLRRPIYFAATEDLFRKRFLGNLIRWFGGFPKRKNANDFRAVKNIFIILKKGGLIGIFPEGVRTWDGSNSPLIPTITRLIRKLRVPVYTCRLEGGYLAYPRWAKNWRRIPVKAVFGLLYSGDDIPQDDERIYRDIMEAIRNRDYELEIDESKYHYKGLAVDITKVLYRCPICGTMEGLKILRPLSKNMIECSSCFSAWRVTIDSRLEPVDEEGKPEGSRIPLSEYTAQIKNMPLLPIRTLFNLPLEKGEIVYLKSRPHFIFIEENFPNLRVLAFGKAYLTNRKLIFKTRLGFPLVADLKDISSISIDPGDKFHFTYRGKFYRILFNRESPVKWYDTISRLQGEIIRQNP